MVFSKMRVLVAALGLLATYSMGYHSGVKNSLDMSVVE